MNWSHVALGHSLAEMKASYAIVAARDAISATSGVASQLPLTIG